MLKFRWAKDDSTLDVKAKTKYSKTYIFAEKIRRISLERTLQESLLQL